MMTTAGLANDAPAVPNGELAFSFALRTDLNRFRVEDGTLMVAVILHVILDQALALLPGAGLADGPGNITCLLVLKLNEKLPFGDESNLSHAYRLYNK